MKSQKRAASDAANIQGGKGEADKDSPFHLHFNMKMEDLQ